MTDRPKYRRPAPKAESQWWGRCCLTYFEALDVSRDLATDYIVHGVEECRDHPSAYVVYAERRAWWKGFTPDHVKIRSI